MRMHCSRSSREKAREAGLIPQAAQRNPGRKREVQRKSAEGPVGAYNAIFDRSDIGGRLVVEVNRKGAGRLRQDPDAGPDCGDGLGRVPAVIRSALEIVHLDDLEDIGLHKIVVHHVAGSDFHIPGLHPEVVVDVLFLDFLQHLLLRDPEKRQQLELVLLVEDEHEGSDIGHIGKVKPTPAGVKAIVGSVVGGQRLHHPALHLVDDGVPVGVEIVFEVGILQRPLIKV